MEQTEINRKPVVLIVEDDTLVRLAGVDILEDAGFDVVQACDADDALAILAQRSDIGVVVTDVEMPGSLDGLALAWRISKRWPNIRIILTSGGQRLSQRSIPRDGLFVQKPFTSSTLVHRICDLTPSGKVVPLPPRARSA